MSTISESTAGRGKTGSDPERGRGKAQIDVLEILERFGLFFLFIAVIILFSLLRPDTFATSANWRQIAIAQSVMGVAALALLLPLIAGRFDISVGANLGFCAIATAAAMSKWHFALVPAIFVGLGFGSLVGLVNGYIVAYLGVNSIIATLGVGTVITGLVIGYTHGIPISTGLSHKLTDLSINKVAGLPILFVILIVISAATWFLLTQTPFGRYMTAVGSSVSSARLTGVAVHRTVLLSFVGAGFLAGAAGVLQISSQGNGDPQVGGITFILPALAAVFLGSTTLRPGTYNLPGTILSVFFLGTTISGLTLVGAEPWVTEVLNGTAVVVAIVLAALLRRRRTGTVEIGS